MSKLRNFCPAVICAASLALPATATAATVFFQGFETDTSGWFDNDDYAGYGDITQVASGTGGITSYEGAAHAIVTDPSNSSGPFTRFDMYRDTWPGTMTASAAIYLDTGWSAGEGFDYSVAANGTDNAHERDFIFHVTKDTSTGKLLVAGSNNTNFDPREDLETLSNFEVVTSGWYVFEHVFTDDGGILNVDLNLRDSGGGLLFTTSLSNLADTIGGTVGGNRYGWLTNVDIAGGIALDASSLQIVPVPAAVWLFGSALGLLGWVRRNLG